MEDGAGGVVHAELELGDGVVMVATEGDTGRSPRSLDGANTQGLFVYVDDVEAHCERARANGAEIVSEPTEKDYGEGHWADRSYGARDREGHPWWFAQRLRTG